jgi:hypothetical protein
MSEGRKNIEPQARLIAALAETMSDKMWADDILIRCRQIIAAAKEIEDIATARRTGGGER